MFLQKLKLKLKSVKFPAQKILASLLLAVFCAFLVPLPALATQGVADDGKDNRTFDITDIVLRPEISAATALDCGNTVLSQLKGDPAKMEQLCKFNTKGYYTIGKNSAEKDKSYLIVKYSIYLEKPIELNVAPKSWGDIFKDFTFGLVGPSAPKVDYVKTGSGTLGFFKINHPVLGIGYGAGLLGTEKCEKKVLSYPWEESEFINSCNFSSRSSGGKDVYQPDNPITWKTGSPVRTIYFAYGPDNNFDGLNINQTGTDYKMVFWPSLYLNVGNRNVKDKILVSATATAVAQLSSGAAQKSLDVVKQGLLKGEAAVKAVVDFFKGTAPEAAKALSEAELQALARGSINWAEDILTWPGNAQSVEQVATRAAELAAKEAIKNGAKVEQATALIGNITKDLAASAGLDATAATNLAEQAAIKAGISAGGAAEAAANGARAASKFGKFVKFAGPAAQVIGPLFNGVQLTFSIFSYTKEHFDIYDSKNTLTLRLYDTEAEAQSHANDPAPDGASNMGSVGGSSSVTKSGSPLLGFINEVITIIVGLVNELIFFVFTFLVVPILESVLQIRTYTDQFAAVIYPGWIVIRNLCNILFIVALITIAMGTLLRIDSYQFRTMLVQLIIAALLVNFSLFVGQAVLGVADTVQNQFLPNNKAVIRSLGGDLMLSYRDTFQKFKAMDFASEGFFSQTIKPIVNVIIAAGTFMVFLAIAAFLCIRIVMLWILLMVSPIAYAAGALPSTSHYREEWWQNFLKYAFFTPIMAFCLNMAAVILNAQKTNPILSQISSANFGDNSLSSFVFHIASNVLIVMFLLVALQAAEKFSIIGADKITGIAKGGMFALPKIAAGYSGRKWNEFTANQIRGHGRKVSFGKAIAFAALNPVAFAKGWAKEKEKKDHRAQEKAELSALEVVQQRFASPKTLLFGGGKIKQHVLAHDKHEEDDEAKNFANMSRENVAKNAAEIFKLGFGEDDLASKRGVIKLAMSKGYIDDIVEEAWRTEEGRAMLKEMEKHGLKAEDFEMKDEVDQFGKKTGKQIKSAIYNNRTRRAMYKAMFGWDGHHFKDHAAGRLITEEGEEEGMNTGHLEYMTDMYFDVQKGEYVFYDMNEDGTSEGEANMAAAEIAKRDSRTQSRIAWHSLMSRNGKFTESVFAKVAKAFVENPGFMQERTANMLIAGTTDVDKIKEIVDHYNKTGELLIDDASKTRLDTMKRIDEKATAAVFQRFINDANPAAIERRLKSGFKTKAFTRDDDGKIQIKKNEKGEDVSAEPYTFRATVSGLTGEVISSLTDEKAENKISGGMAAKITPVLKKYEEEVKKSNSFAEYNTLVDRLVSEAGITRTESLGIATQYIEKFTIKRMADKNADVVSTDVLVGTDYDVASQQLSTKGLGKFAAVLRSAVAEGMLNASRYTTDAERINQVELAVKKELSNKEVQKKLGTSVDLGTIFKVDEFATNIYNKLK